jgi:hypothetical protein
MRFGTMTGYPTGGDILYSIESDTPTRLSTHHYHDPVTLHLHSLTSVHIHRQSDDVTPPQQHHNQFQLCNNEHSQDPPQARLRSSNGELPENPENLPLDSKASHSSATLLEGTKDYPQRRGAEDWNGLTNPDNPKAWSRRKKICHIFVPSAMAFLT